VASPGNLGKPGGNLGETRSSLLVHLTFDLCTWTCLRSGERSVCPRVPINDLGDAAPASYGALAAGAVGVRNMSIYMTATKKVIKRAGLRDGVPVIGEIAALYDSGMALLEASKVNQACTALVYGH
jgi:hypothetical protein